MIRNNLGQLQRGSKYLLAAASLALVAGCASTPYDAWDVGEPALVPGAMYGGAAYPSYTVYPAYPVYPGYSRPYELVPPVHGSGWAQPDRHYRDQRHRGRRNQNHNGHANHGRHSNRWQNGRPRTPAAPNDGRPLQRPRWRDRQPLPKPQPNWSRSQRDGLGATPSGPPGSQGAGPGDRMRAGDGSFP